MSEPPCSVLAESGATTLVATMSRAMKIDVMQDDRGLQSCLVAANLKREWYDPFIQFHKIETLDDFIFMVQSSDTEKSLFEMAQAVREIKE